MNKPRPGRTVGGMLLPRILRCYLPGCGKRRLGNHGLSSHIIHQKCADGPAQGYCLMEFIHKDKVNRFQLMDSSHSHELTGSQLEPCEPRQPSKAIPGALLVTGDWQEGNPGPLLPHSLTQTGSVCVRGRELESDTAMPALPLFPG